MDLRLAVGCTDLERAGPQAKEAPPLDGGALDFGGSRKERRGRGKSCLGGVSVGWLARLRAVQIRTA